MELRKFKTQTENDIKICFIYEWKIKYCDTPSCDKLITKCEAVRAHVHKRDRINMIGGLLYRTYTDTDEVPTSRQILVPGKLRGNFFKLANGND